MMMFCPKCGAKSIEGGGFCQKCGASLLDKKIPQLDSFDFARETTPHKSDTDAADDGTTVTWLDVTLMDAGNSQVKVMAAINKWLGFGIGESRELVEKVPIILKRNVTMEDAEFIKRMFTKAGADISFSDKSGQIVDIIPHCRVCGKVVDVDSDTCTSCGHLLSIPSVFQTNPNEEFGGLHDSFVWSELWDEFMLQTLNKKIFIVLGILAVVLFMVLLLRIICSSFITLIAIPAVIYFIYQYWGADYVMQFIYNKSSKELLLPDGMTSQTLIESLSGKFNYPYFKGARYGKKGECLIEGQYAVYPVLFDEDNRAFLNYDEPDNGEKIHIILREAIAVRSYINKFFNPNLPFDAVKELKALKSVERQYKAVKFVMSVASLIFIILITLEYTFPGGLQYITKPGMEVRQSYLTQYSESITVEEAFDNFFENGKWSRYKTEGYSYVVFTGACEYLGERADVRVTFKITGENFTVDSLDVNGKTQNNLILYALLTKIYENY